VLGAVCPKNEAEEIQRKITTFLKEELKLNTSVSKSGIKHHSEIIRFLGYDITMKNTERIVKLMVNGQQCKKRTLKSHRALTVPEAKMKGFADKHGYGNWERMDAIHRPLLAQCSDTDIALQYSAEMRGIAQYYGLANNFSKALGRLRFLGIQRFLKTMANTRIRMTRQCRRWQPHSTVEDTWRSEQRAKMEREGNRSSSVSKT
jgi:RNA-directed DNA polymerase